MQCECQVPIVRLLRCAEMMDKRYDIAPFQIVGGWMLKNLLHSVEVLVVQVCFLHDCSLLSISITISISRTLGKTGLRRG